MPDTKGDERPRGGRITGDDHGVGDPGGSRPAPTGTPPMQKPTVESGDRNAMTEEAPATKPQ